MAKKTQNSTLADKLLTKLNTVWVAIIAGCTIFGSGFGAGSYVSNIFKKIEITELNQKHNEQLYNQKIEHDKQFIELVQEKNLLEIENGKLRKK